MKKYSVIALAFVLTAAMLTGCRRPTNEVSPSDTTAAPTTIAPTTIPTTAPTTAPTTMPTTEATMPSSTEAETDTATNDTAPATEGSGVDSRIRGIPGRR